MRTALGALALLALTAGVFLPVRGFDFINFDDDLHVTENPQVLAGLTTGGLRWALSSFHAANWMPLTWVSHMADVSLFGLHAGAHHLVNLLLHAVNAVLVLRLLQGATGAFWPSLAVAAAFAVHPLHVEPVAWVSQRRDVLSLFFGLLCLEAWVRHTRRPRPLSLASSLAFLALGLAAKPALIPLPALLVLLDWWPLGRRVRLAEKIPFFLLAAGSAAVTYLAQASGGALAPGERFPLGVRAANAALATVQYLGDLVWPSGLAIFYPHPARGISLAAAGAAALGIAAVVWLAWRSRHRRPWRAVGVLWYLAALLPVSGLIQVGAQGRADRYTYLSLAGPLLALAWEAAALTRRRRLPPAAVATAALALLVPLAWAARRQVLTWRDSRTVFSHALRVTTGNWLAHNNLGVALAAGGEVREAEEHFRAALSLAPDYPITHYNLGNALAGRGELQDAAAHYGAAIAAWPGYAQAHSNLGALRERQGRLAEARQAFAAAVRADPDFAAAHYNLASLLGRSGDLAEAERHLRAALRVSPAYAEARHNLGNVLLLQGRRAEAAREYREALRLQPENAGARANLERLLREETGR